jgi:UDP-N-acetylglucosamine 1-carboxyvinyltransferase
MGSATIDPAVFVVQGGQPLSGTIDLRGAKNAATKILLATLLSAEPSVIRNVPLLGDTDITAELIERIGGTVTRKDGAWTVVTPTISQPSIPPLSRKNRIPILALGPLLHRHREVSVPLVGGDAIGPRPVDYHLAALRMMGAEFESSTESLKARTDGLHGATINLPYPSVGATENIILAAVLASGRTMIRNAAVEPEVLDLVEVLQTMGAIIELGTNRTLYIDGVRELHGTDFTVMPDRNEAVSFACLALATGGDVTVRGARQEHLMTWLNTVRRIGGHYDVHGDCIRFYRRGPLQAVNVETDTHPGFMTDWQQPLVTVMTQAAGQSVVHETVYEDRFGYVQALRDMGATITTTTDCLGNLPCRWWARGLMHSAVITGPTPLHGATVTIPDIRAGMAHLVGALTATGESTLKGIEHIDRGYQSLDARLVQIGARLTRQEPV